MRSDGIHWCAAPCSWGTKLGKKLHSQGVWVRCESIDYDHERNVSDSWPIAIFALITIRLGVGTHTLWEENFEKVCPIMSIAGIVLRDVSISDRESGNIVSHMPRQLQLWRPCQRHQTILVIFWQLKDEVWIFLPGLTGGSWSVTFIGMIQTTNPNSVSRVCQSLDAWIGWSRIVYHRVQRIGPYRRSQVAKEHHGKYPR